MPYQSPPNRGRREHNAVVFEVGVFGVQDLQRIDGKYHKVKISVKG